MKHWAYIGMVLIVGNASLLGGVRAAELTPREPAYPQPRFDIFRFPMADLFGKPHREMISPVTIRLFAGQKLKALWLKNSAGFLISDRKMKGPIYVSVQNGRLYAHSGGRREMLSPQIAVRSLDDQAFEIKTPQGSHKWTRGELRLGVVKGRLQAINRLELEDYVSGILESELGTLNLSPEVLKAQMVVARSYVLSMRHERHSGEGYEFCDLPHCQVFGGVPTEANAQLEVAIAQVKGQYLSYKGRPIAAFYHHNCGGMTSAVQDVWPAPASPYLKAVREAPDGVCRVSPKSQWRMTLSRKTLAACFKRAGWIKRGDAPEVILIVRKDRSDRVQELEVQSRKSIQLSVGRFRNVVNQYYGREVLKSALFTVSREGGSFVFSGRGWGHGVGFCQEGAKQLARQGKTYQQILTHYFPKTKISRLN